MTNINPHTCYFLPHPPLIFFLEPLILLINLNISRIHLHIILSNLLHTNHLSFLRYLIRINIIPIIVIS